MESLYLANKLVWCCCEILEKEVEKLSVEADIHPMLARILLSRGIRIPYEISRIMNPSINMLYDPFLMKGMDTAVERIIDAVNNRENVIIYGDYDVDGVTAASILIHFLKKHNIKAECYIPDRFDEGYGLSDLGIDYILSGNYSLMITVDCGITAYKQIDKINNYCRENIKRNLDVIITDHHQCNNSKIPDALAVINPHQEACPYPFKDLCGAGISFKLVQAVCDRAGWGQEHLEYLDLAALGTIADIVSLKSENRVLVKFGLEKLLKLSKYGINALVEVSGMDPERLDAYKVAYALAPRINAAGRMGSATKAVELFTVDSLSLAKSIAEDLNEKNRERQDIQAVIVDEAMRIIELNRLNEDMVIIVDGEKWHHGVIGIVASKVVEIYHRPCFVLSVNDGIATGSGRSIEGFNLFDAMTECSGILIKYGGHEQAGGLTLRKDNIQAFRTQINKYACNVIDEELLIKKLHIDTEISPEDISLNTAGIIQSLEPYGQDNKKPVFLCRNLTVLQKKTVGDGKHLKLKLGAAGSAVDGIAFQKGEYSRLLMINDKLDLVFTMDINEWMGRKSVQLIIMDIRLTSERILRNRFFYRLANQLEQLDSSVEWIYNDIKSIGIKLDEISIMREDLTAIYRCLVSQGVDNLQPYVIFHMIRSYNWGDLEINYFKVLSALKVFEELGLTDKLPKDSEKMAVQVKRRRSKVDLEESRILKDIRSLAEGLGEIS